MDQIKQLTKEKKQFGEISYPSAKKLLQLLLAENNDEATIYEVFSAFSIESLKAQELRGFVDEAKEQMIPCKIETKKRDKVIDIVGTGGDESNSFNISTITALLLSSCGIKVLKHGNSSSTSISGSADILNATGANLNISEKAQQIAYDELGFVFLYAKRSHPAFRSVAVDRKSYYKDSGKKTFFNLLGPLVNPSEITDLFIGLGIEAAYNVYKEYLNTFYKDRYLMVRSDSGMDELAHFEENSLTSAEGQSKLSISDLKELELYGDKKDAIDSITVQNTTDALRIFNSFLDGNPETNCLNIVLLNFLYAYKLLHPKAKPEKIIQIGREAIAKKKLGETYSRYQEISNIS